MTPEQEAEFEKRYAQELLEKEFEERYAQELAAAEETAAPSTKDYVAAVASGANRGVLTGLTGLPVDTMSNILDLAKAGAGYTASKLSSTGRVPEWAELVPREEVPGSSAWIARKMEEGGLGPIIDNPVNTPGGRALHGAGSFAGQALVSPATSAKNALLKATLAAPAGGISTSLAEQTDSPAVGALSALLMGQTPSAAANASRWALRGSGAGNRAQVNQNIQDFKNVDLTPSLGQAMQGTPRAGMWQGVENLISGLPGGLGRIKDFRDTQHATLQDLAENAGGVGSNPPSVGRAVQQSLANKIADVRQASRDINDSLEARGGGDTRVVVPSTQAMLQRMTEQAPKDPELNALLQIPHTQQLQQAIADTTAAVPPRQVPHPSRMLDASGNTMTITIPGRPAQGVALSSLRPLQQQLGEDAFANFTVTPPSTVRQQRQLYGALGEDMAAGLRASDPQAAQMLARSKRLNTALLGSNSATNPVRGRMETIEPLLEGKLVPERTYAALESRIMGQNPNLTEFNAIKKSLDPDARAQFASTVVNRLGRATNSRQDASGEAFSPEAFLTNYSKLTPDARDALFSGFSGAMKLRRDADNAATVIANMREGSKIYGNPSGTANRGGAMGIYSGLIGGLGATAFTGNPLPLAGALAIPASINAGARFLLSPKVARFAGSTNTSGNTPAKLARVAVEANEPQE